MSKKLTPSIMVIEDEESITAIISYNLKKAGYLVTTVNDGAEAVALCLQHKPDLILLDWMLPGLSGIEICRVIRSTPDISNTPIIMISARNEEIDKIMGLDRGADDYISKPFSPNELLARIKAVLRRMRPVFSSKILEFKDIKLNISSHTVTRNGKEVELSPIEFKILQMLVENPSRVLSREFIMDKIWGNEVFIGSRTIDVHITRLRKALLSASTDDIDLVKTIRLGGYSLNVKKEGNN